MVQSSPSAREGVVVRKWTLLVVGTMATVANLSLMFLNNIENDNNSQSSMNSTHQPYQDWAGILLPPAALLSLVALFLWAGVWRGHRWLCTAYAGLLVFGTTGFATFYHPFGAAGVVVGVVLLWIPTLLLTTVNTVVACWYAYDLWSSSSGSAEGFHQHHHPSKPNTPTKQAQAESTTIITMDNRADKKEENKDKEDQRQV